MKHGVNAVIVTCNRCELLKKSLESLLSQKYELNRIIVVNNASSDGTREYLDSIQNEKIVVLHRETNEGGAGGFYYGIKEAYEIGCDFVWIMDDDTIAVPESLENLMAGYEVVQNRPVGFLACNVLYKDGTPCFMNICRPEYVWSEFVGDGIVRITHCSFVAMLIPSWVIKEVGYPIKEYFIWGDDGEYSTRILQKYEGYLCGKSVVYHYMNENVGVDIWNIDQKRIGRFFYFYRNWMCTNRMRSGRQAKEFEKESRQLISAIRKSNTLYKKQKIAVIKKGLRTGRKFQVEIQYPEGHGQGTETQKPGEKQRRSMLFRAARYFLIKQDIRTQGHVTYCKELYWRFIKVDPPKLQKVQFLLAGARRTNLYDSGSKTEDLKKLLEECRLQFCDSKYFAYAVDVYKSWKIKTRQMANCAIDYELLLQNGLKDLLMTDSGAYAEENNCVAEIIRSFAGRMSREVGKSRLSNKKNIGKWLANLWESPAASLEEAMQRILLMNQMMWQTRHIQIGLGRVDLLLGDYVTEEMTDEYLDGLFSDFVQVLHNYYWLKSEEMPGDTGQIMILGGVDCQGNPVCNRVTYAVIRAVKKMQLPDPKVLLRVTEATPDSLWKLAVECLATGIGCPLISNDGRVIPELERFGYDTEDARGYVTSACWEIIPKNSCEQNNIGEFDFSMPFDLLGRKEDLEALDTWDKFIWQFSVHLCGHVYYMVHLLDNIKWEKDPLMSFLTASCRESRTDISEGGGKYNNYGILSVGLSNAVNSLINIRKYVYREQRFTLRELYTMRGQNYAGHEDVLALLKNSRKYFGQDDPAEDALGLSNWLILRVNEAVASYENCLGGKVKFGLSSPGYIIMGKNTSATFDGRLDYEPYSVHISADDNQNPTALLNFAARLNYGKAGFNGNVVDFTLNPQFVRDNMDKFVQLLKASAEMGVFQIQINVISGKTLMEARKAPEKYPNLIVRVWGFSAYFKDLPDEYKDYVVARALKNETAYY